MVKNDKIWDHESIVLILRWMVSYCKWKYFSQLHVKYLHCILHVSCINLSKFIFRLVLTNQASMKIVVL